MFTKKITTISLFVFWAITAAILAAGLVFYQAGKDEGGEEVLQAEDRSISGDSLPATVLSFEEAAKHNSAGDCWLVVKNKIYSVSSYLNKHPGDAETITPFCGKDATAAFEGKPHSEEAWEMLAPYYVGDIGQSINGDPAASSDPKNAPTSESAPVQAPTNTPNSGTSNQNTGQGSTKTLSLAEIAKHNSAADCWLIMNSKVYNVTSYLKSHPGGSKAITPYCGKDGAAAFTGLPHSTKASNILASYFIGNVGATINVQPNAVNQNPASGQSSAPQPSPTSYQKWDDEEEDD